MFLNKVPEQFYAFNPKNASQRDAKDITPLPISQLEKRTSSRATDIVLVALNFRDNGNHLYSHRFKPPMEPCVL